MTIMRVREDSLIRLLLINAKWGKIKCHLDQKQATFAYITYVIRMCLLLAEYFICLKMYGGVFKYEIFLN